MAYEKTNWEVSTFQKGDATFVSNLNHIEDGIEGAEGQVIANPSLTGTEGLLTGIQVGTTKYKAPAEVSANPTLEGTETELTGLQIDSTKYKIPTKRTFPSDWPTTGTCQAFLETVGDSSEASVGKTYQGGIAFSDLQTDLGLGNAEAEVEIISSTLSTNYKIVWLNIYSANIAPYHWSRVYWWKGSSSSSTLGEWLIGARKANQYTTPVNTGTCDNTTGAITLQSTLEKGVYIISMCGTQGGTNTSRTYYFAYEGDETYMAYSCDCKGSRISAHSGSLTFEQDSATGGPNWDASPTVELYKMT